MRNLSYCRYENTSKDLDDCVEALSKSNCGETLSSEYETQGLIRILELAKEIVSMEDKILNIIDNQETDY